MDKKKILLIGCSNLAQHHYEWARAFGLSFVIEEGWNYSNHRYHDAIVDCGEYEIHNLSQPGCGNHYIFGRLHEWIELNGKPDYIYLQFSGLQRVDIPLSKFYELDQDLQDPRDFRETNFFKWVVSGGRAGSWRFKDKNLQRFFSCFYEADHSDHVEKLSLCYASSAVNLCLHLNIPFNWTFYYNILNPPTKNTRQDGMIEKFPLFMPTRNMLNDPHSYVLDRGELDDDGVHFYGYPYECWIRSNKHLINLKI